MLRIKTVNRRRDALFFRAKRAEGLGDTTNEDALFRIKVARLTVRKRKVLFRDLTILTNGDGFGTIKIGNGQIIATVLSLRKRHSLNNEDDRLKNGVLFVDLVVDTRNYDSLRGNRKAYAFLRRVVKVALQLTTERRTNAHGNRDYGDKMFRRETTEGYWQRGHSSLWYTGHAGVPGNSTCAVNRAKTGIGNFRGCFIGFSRHHHTGRAGFHPT